MEWKLFASTFVLIFLAELGDKTQLTAFASASTARSPWPVFAGASAALVLSSLIAVLVGHHVKDMVPQTWIRAAAGLLFLAMGAHYLIGLARAPEAAPSAEMPAAGAPAPALPRWLAAVRESALAFEEAAASSYRALAESVSDPARRALLLAVAEEEEAHAHRLAAPAEAVAAVSSGTAETAAEPLEALLARYVPPGSLSSFAELLRHEEAKVDFYRSLARSFHHAGAKSFFNRLAAEEESHVARLRAFLAGEEG